MRKNKYRAWYKGTWMKQGTLGTTEKKWKMGIVHTIHLNRNKVMLSTDFGIEGFEVGEDCFVMQYTGLKDENGVEIYEKDIVVHEDGEYSFKAVVEYDQWQYYMKGIYPKDAFCFSDSTDKGNSDVEVIGNIYENPELLDK